MRLNKFRIGVVARALLLAATFAAGYELWRAADSLAALAAGAALGAAQLYWLFATIDAANRDLKRFLDAVRFRDFSQAFDRAEWGESFRELNESFAEIMSDFRKERERGEEREQYLRAVVGRVGAGLISFDDAGKVDFINPAAVELTGMRELTRLSRLRVASEELANVIAVAEPGESRLAAIERKEGRRVLAVRVARFSLRGRILTVCSLQDIGPELERERMTRELEIARQTQARLFPVRFPDRRGCRVAAIHEPAKEVGGDYYDFAEPSDDRLVFVVGDVSGKGAPAAMYMTLVKGVFLASAGARRSPSGALAEFNRLLRGVVDPGSFVTALYVDLDCRTGEFSLARAGHNPPLRYRAATGAIEELKPGGVAIGMANDERFRETIEEATGTLEPGDALLLYTDGGVEAGDPATELYGEERLGESFLRHVALPVGEAIEKIRDDVANFGDAPRPRDDTTFLLVKRDLGS
jgi:PAS domain-containing protein